MKKISSFLVRLKPYKRLYKIFWMSFIIICMFLFQMLMLILSTVVPHNNSGFSYWIHGLHGLLVESRGETNAAQGFIFAGTIIGFIPIIPIIPVLYFTFANWLIQERISEKFIETPKEKYLKWANFSHFSILGVSFMLIPGLLTYLGGGGILPHQAFYAVPAAFTNDFGARVGGIAAFLYYGVGCLFTTIVLFWGTFMLFGWIFEKIGIFFANMRESRMQRQEEKRQEKLGRHEAKRTSGKKNGPSTDTTQFDTTDDF